jgi:hypothetical protein
LSVLVVFLDVGMDDPAPRIGTIDALELSKNRKYGVFGGRVPEAMGWFRME